MDIVISTFQKAICDGISLLTRTRFHRSAPTYLVWPRRPLEVKVVSISESGPTIRTAVVFVMCRTWSVNGTTIVKLTLDEDLVSWRLRGPFGIVYAPGYPVASLANRVVDTKAIYPVNMTRPDAARPMEYRIRSRVRPGR